MADNKVFTDKAPVFMDQLMTDFGFKDFQAAGVFGNIGHECAGFTTLHEIGQPVNQGGYGWAQWTGPRRVQFLDWCHQQGFDWQSDEGNFGFLEFELRGAYKGTVTAVLATSTLEDAVRAFQIDYEGAGVVNYPSWNNWAQIALTAYTAYKASPTS